MRLAQKISILFNNQKLGTNGQKLLHTFKTYHYLRNSSRRLGLSIISREIICPQYFYNIFTINPKYQVVTVYYCWNKKVILQPIWKFRKEGEQRGVERRRVVDRRVEGNGSPPLCLDVFKISKGEGSNQSFPLFGCFKNQDGDEKK